MKLCHICKLKQTKTDTILEFPFKIYTDRNELATDLLQNINKDKYLNSRVLLNCSIHVCRNLI